LESLIEAILFASGEPVKAERIADVTGASVNEIFAAAQQLRDDLVFDKRGIRLVKLDDSLQLVSSPDYYEEIRKVLETRKPPKLSPAALEALAIIAYEQPITRAQIDAIRGVDSKYTLSTLMERGLIEMRGRVENVPGRPPLYCTTDMFLRSIGMEDIEQLKNYKPEEAEQLRL
jgi:segregation and condensation protein B